MENIISLQYCSPGSVDVSMVIFTTDETTTSEVETSVQSSFQGGCQATSDSGNTYLFGAYCGELLPIFQRIKMLWGMVMTICRGWIADATKSFLFWGVT